jgi:hypothetical protein
VAQFRVIERPRDLAIEICRIAWLDEQPGHTIGHGARQPADAAGDDRNADTITSTEARLSESWAIVGTRHISASR